MEKKKSFLLYIERKKELALLTDAQAGQLFKAIFEYVDSGTEAEFSDLAMALIFSVFKSQIDAASEKYDEICKKRAEGQRRRWEKQKKQDGAAGDSQVQVSQNDTSVYKLDNLIHVSQIDSDTVTVTDTGTETDTETDTGTDTGTETDTEKINNDFYMFCFDVVNTRTREGNAPQTTKHTKKEIVECLKSLGLSWSAQEVEAFQSYNDNSGWKLPLDMAVKRWDARRFDKDSMTDQERETMNDYLSLVNNFGEEENSDGSGNASPG